jgi:hypothetical protein
MQTNSKHNSAQLDALQGFEQNILKHHERFTDKILNHIVYIDKEIWGSPEIFQGLVVAIIKYSY